MPDAKYCPRDCWCEKCWPMTMSDPGSIRMILCPDCGNKRCPHATDHRNTCTGSNLPGQPGSSYQGYWDAAPAQAEPREWTPPREMVKHVQPYRYEAAPSPAAEDALTYSLKQIVASNAVRADIRNTIAEAAASIERQAQEIAEMKRERQARNAIDPVTRLHNICDAMAEDRADSPYSQEAWDAQDEAYREKCADLAAALRRAEALREALLAVTENMDRAGGDRDGMPECPWCRSGPDGDKHSPDCELVAARAALASPAETKGTK